MLWWWTNERFWFCKFKLKHGKYANCEKKKKNHDRLLLSFAGVSGVFAHGQLHILNVLFRLTAVCETATSNKKRDKRTLVCVGCVDVKSSEGKVSRLFNLQSALKLLLPFAFNYIIELIYSALISCLLNWVIKLSRLNQLYSYLLIMKWTALYSGRFLECSPTSAARLPLIWFLCSSNAVLSLLLGSNVAADLKGVD